MSNILNLGDIVLPGSGYLNIYGLTVPVTANLQGAFIFGDGDISGRNYAAGGPQASVVGTPAQTDNGITLDGSNYIDTGIAQTTDMTFIVVARLGHSADRAGVIGNYNTTGIAIFDLSAANTSIAGNLQRNGATSQANTDTTANQYQLIAFRAGVSSNSRIQNVTLATDVSNTANTSPVINLNSETIKIGRLPATSFVGPVDIAAVLIYDRVLSDAEANDDFTWARNYMASRGVSV